MNYAEFVPDRIWFAERGLIVAEHIALERFFIEESDAAKMDKKSRNRAVSIKNGEFHQSFKYAFKTAN
jgi:hypothetical protein